MIHPETIITRYMNKSKFESLLHDGLYLSKVTEFKDDLEGILPYFLKESSDNHLNKEQIRRALEWVYVSCWYNDKAESPKMWDKYGGNEEAIAIQTSAFHLQRLFLNEEKNVQAYFDEISYKDPIIETFKKHRSITVLTSHLANEGYPQLVFSALFSFYKHTKFSDEKEIRLAVIDSNADKNTQNSKKGIFLKRVNSVFFKTVIVSPGSSPNFKKEIQSLLIRNNINIEVSDSSISKKS